VSEKIVYEHPLSEKTRTLLRLEHLFDQVGFHMPRSEPWHSRVAVHGLLDVLSLVSRADLKSELIKEIDRYLSTLERIRAAPGVDLSRLGQILGKLSECREELDLYPGTFGKSLRRNDFLKAIQQRSPIPGGSCAFDLPQFHYWLSQPHESRQSDLDVWLSELTPIERTVRVLMVVIRGSATSVEEMAARGFFQLALDAQAPVHMVRVALDAGLPLFAEISGGKHRISVRFMEPRELERPTQTEDDVPFALTACTI
jgi:cell division protein ZapD